MNNKNLRADGATRGDRIEATALVIAGVVLLFVPLLAVIDELTTPWQLLSGAIGMGGLGIGSIGLRWFRREGPGLESSLATADARFMATEPAATPLDLRLVEAGQRFIAHCLRFVALGSGALLMLVDLGPLRWLVVAMFGTSFLADQWLLRPRSYVLHDDGLRRRGLLSPVEVPWPSVRAVFWRHYPGSARPLFPSGERLILELNEGADLEFVFRGGAATADASKMARALVAQLDNRVRVLSPRRARTDIENRNVSEHVSGASADAEA